MLTRTPEAGQEKGFWALVILLGVMGGVYAASYPVYMSFLDNGRALAGITPSIPGAPWSQYLTGSWSLLNQAAGLLLGAGFTESALSIMFSALQGALGFVCAGTLAYASGRNAWLAVLAALAVFEFSLKGQGPAYPIDVITYHAHGAAGLMGMFLCLGFAGSGRIGPALFIAGLLPSAHLPWGAFLLLCLGLASLADPAWSAGQLRRFWPWLAAGAAVSAASYAMHAFGGHAVLSEADSFFASEFTASYYANFWDHRTAFHLALQDALQMAVTVILTAAFLLPAGRTSGRHRAFMCAALAASCACAASLFGLAEILGSKSFFFRIMPGRYLNVAIFPAIPLLFGSLLTRGGGWLPEILVLVAALAASCLGFVTPVPFVAMCVVLALVRLLAPYRHTPDPVGLPHPRVLALAVVVMAGVFWVSAWPGADLRIKTWSNDGFMALIDSRPGGLLVGGGVPPVITRRAQPVTFAMDYVPYLPGTAKPLYDRVRDIFGLDIFAPGDHQSLITSSDIWNQARRHWMALSRQQWGELGTRYGFTDVVVAGDMVLDLPLVGSSCGLNLYEVSR